jgi:4-amino-4-deoxychorismate lyase
MMLINGQPGDSISALDRAAMYGDGVFRTMRIRDGRVPGWQRHYRKLAADCVALAIACPPQAILRAELDQIISMHAEGVAKIVISRGVGGRGYKATNGMVPTRMVMVAPLPDYPADYWQKGVALHLCELRLAHQPRLAGIKHLNRLENVLARREWHDADVPEGLLLDQAGWVIEGTMSNLFVRQGSVMRTPDLSQCGVAGVQRERILELAPRLGLRAEIAQMNMNTVLGADEVWVCNSVIGVWPVRAVGTRAVPVGETVHALQSLLENETD